MARAADSASPAAARTDGSSRALPPRTRIAAARSTYHGELTGAMLESARAELRAAGLAEGDLVTVDVPGAFELPIVARALAVREDVSAVLCFGLVLKGETSHDLHIASSVSHALQQVALDTDKPVLFGVLTCDTLEQARARALPDGHDKGREVARAAIDVLAALAQARLGAARPQAGFGPGPKAGGGA